MKKIIELAFGISMSLIPFLVFSETGEHEIASKESKIQAPGFYRTVVGDLVVTAIYDGYVELNPKHLSGLSKEKIQQYIFDEYQRAAPNVQTAVNTFIIDYGDELTLVDSGSSDCFGPTMGKMLNNIEAAGYNPSDIKNVLLTHMHPDHACGITKPDGKAAFPNAVVWAEKLDADYWLDKKMVNTLPEDQMPFFGMARKAIAPYAKTNRFKTFSEGGLEIPGIKVLPSHGHTPGHTSYLLTSQDDSLLLWGDIIHMHAVQLREPEVTISVDVDPNQAKKSRMKLLSDASKNRWLVAAAHLPFPGIGYLGHYNDGYRWIPVEYRNPIQPEK
jgi:glyoxylase-like metal-dependent hydrolase (beta-lactamase superfamily II)